MPPLAHGIEYSRVHRTIRLLINQLISIQDETGEFLLPLPDGRIIDTKSWNTQSWEWTHGIGLYGIWKYYQLTADPSLLKLIEDWFAARLLTEGGGTTKNINTMAVFLTLACLYEKTRNEAYRPWLETWAEWAMHDLPRTTSGGMQHATYLTDNHQQLWDDTLMMTVMPLAKIGKILNRPEYVAEAKRQFLIHITYLFDRESGLWFHGWQFHDDRSAGLGHNFARARWARGNSWITIVIPEFLELIEDELSPNDPFRTHLLDILESQCAALVSLQEPSGLWRTLLDHPADEGSYPEASATAGFAYGILKARRKRYLGSTPPNTTTRNLPDGKTYDEVAVKAINAILDNVSEDGELLNVSFGTGMGDSLQFYKDIPKTSMPYGQAMAIMALGEFARAFL
ncbi:hypothetical protein VTO42DRAFT_3315 [Malbranchea cinnamomea]